MRWDLIRTTIAATIAGLLPGFDATNIVWEGEFPARSYVTTTRIVLAVSPERSIGENEERRADAEGDDDSVLDQVVVLCGPREFTLSIKVESQKQPPEGEKLEARYLIDKICTRLDRKSALAQLLTAQLGKGRVLSKIYRDEVRSGRTVTYAAADVLMLGVENDVDDTPGAGGWIGRVIGEGTLQPGDEPAPFDTANVEG